MPDPTRARWPNARLLACPRVFSTASAAGRPVMRPLAAGVLALAGCAFGSSAQAGDEVKVLLEILLEKGILTQQEYDSKLKKLVEAEDIRAFNEAQDVRKASREIEQRAEAERKYKTQIYGQVSAGYYDASNMKGTESASGLSDQPKGNNRIGLKVIRQFDADTSAVVTLESNFSSRTGAVGKDAAVSGEGVSPLLDREASVRLVSKPYGTLLFGRGPTLQNDLSSAFDARQNWNFGGLKAVARYAGFHSSGGLNRADKLIRYSSPDFAGLTIDGGVSLGGIPGGSERGTHYYLGGRYKRGPFELAYSHIEARLSYGTPTVIPDNTNNRVDFFAAKYTMDKLTLNVGYAITRNPLLSTATLSTASPGGKADVDSWFAGAVYRVLPTLSANLGWYEVKDKTPTRGLNDLRMIATGLTWSPYKEWDFFVDYATVDRKDGATAVFSIYDTWRPDTSSKSPLAAGTRDQSGVSVGALYKF